MSSEIFEHPELLVTRYCGPERADGGRRTMVQINTFGIHGERWGAVAMRAELFEEMVREIAKGLES